MIDFLYRIFWRLKVTYCFLVRPVTLGVKALVLNSDGQVLLVKHTYKPGWHLPGGAVDRGETALTAAKREAQEEVGVVCDQEPEVWPGLFYNTGDFKNDHVALFVVRTWHFEENLKSAGEIAEAKFFDAGALPVDVNPGCGRRIRQLADGMVPGFEW